MPTILKRRLSVFLFLCCSMLFIVMSPKTAYALSFQVPTDINAALMPDGTIVNSSFSTGSNTSGDPLIISGDLSLNSGFEGVLVFKNHNNTKDIEIGVGDKIEGSVSITKVDKSLDYSNRNLIGKISWNIQPKLKTAFAVFSQDDGSLNFYKRNSIPKAGEQFEDKIATEVYLNIETSDYGDGVNDDLEGGNKPNWIANARKIKSVKIVDKIKPISCAFWFINMEYVTSDNFNINMLDTSECRNMRSMFMDMLSLTRLDLSHFKTPKLTNMNNMFDDCLNITTLNVSSFDTSNVTDMRSVFNDCRLLTSIDVSNFDASAATRVRGMFYSCMSLTRIDLSNLRTNGDILTDSSRMFEGCTKLEYLDIRGLNVRAQTDMSSIFKGCTSLATIVRGKEFYCNSYKAYMPSPDPAFIPGADGYWYDLDTGYAYLNRDVPSNKEATYIAVNPIKAPIVTVDGSPIYGSKLSVNVTNQPSDTTETTYQWQEYNQNAAGKGWYNSTLPGSETNTLTLTIDENGISCKDKMYRCVVNTKAGLKRVPQVISDVIGPIKQNLSGAIKISTKNISGDKYQSDVLTENVQSDAVLSYEWHGKAVIGDSYGADVGLSSKHKNTITVYDDAQITISQMDNNYSRNGWDVRIKNSNNQEVYHSGIQYSGFVRTTLLPGTYTIEIINTDPVSHSFFAEYSSYKEKILPETKSSYVFSSNELKPDSIYCIVRDSSGKYIGSLDSRNN